MSTGVNAYIPTYTHTHTRTRTHTYIHTGTTHTTNARPDHTSTPTCNAPCQCPPSKIALAHHTLVHYRWDNHASIGCHGPRSPWGRSMWRMHMSANWKLPVSKLVGIKGEEIERKRERGEKKNSTKEESRIKNQEEEKNFNMQWSRQWSSPPVFPIDRGLLLMNGSMINVSFSGRSVERPVSHPFTQIRTTHDPLSIWT